MLALAQRDLFKSAPNNQSPLPVEPRPKRNVRAPVRDDDPRASCMSCATEVSLHDYRAVYILRPRFQPPGIDPLRVTIRWNIAHTCVPDRHHKTFIIKRGGVDVASEQSRLMPRSIILISFRR